MSESAHPLAEELAHEHPEGTLLLVGIGNGRNLLPFLERRDRLIVADADSTRLLRVMAQKKCDANHIRFIHTRYESLPLANGSITAALSTHVLQHGVPGTMRAILYQLQRVLANNGSLSLVLGSQRDPRFGKGTKIAADCWAPTEGDEVGIPHLYFNKPGLYELLTEHFIIRSMEEHATDSIVGSWAHTKPQGLIHWFVQAIKR